MPDEVFVAGWSENVQGVEHRFELSTDSRISVPSELWDEYQAAVAAHEATQAALDASRNKLHALVSMQQRNARRRIAAQDAREARKLRAALAAHAAASDF